MHLFLVNTIEAWLLLQFVQSDIQESEGLRYVFSVTVEDLAWPKRLL